MFKKLLSFVKKEDKGMEDNFSSEALKIGIKPSKPVNEMTQEEIKEFLSTIDPDQMGFDGREGVE